MNHVPMLEAVLAELERRRGRLAEVCAAVPGVEYSWLTKVLQRRIKDPSVNRIQALFDHLCVPGRPSVAAESQGRAAPAETAAAVVD